MQYYESKFPLYLWKIEFTATDLSKNRTFLAHKLVYAETEFEARLRGGLADCVPQRVTKI